MILLLARRFKGFGFKLILSIDKKFKFSHFQGDDFEVKNRERRDANGNRILRVVKRDATEMAEVETTEKIIQVKI